jgi:putative NADH-flavin reductase
MKLLIFGATGQTGHYLLKGALAQGHHVCVLVRDPQKLSVSLPEEQIQRGDVYDSDAVERALRGNEASLFVIGSGDWVPPRSDKMRCARS